MIDDGRRHQIRHRQPFRRQRGISMRVDLADEPVAVRVADDQAVEQVLFMLFRAFDDVRRGEARLRVGRKAVHGQKILRHHRDLHFHPVAMNQGLDGDEGNRMGRKRPRGQAQAEERRAAKVAWQWRKKPGTCKTLLISIPRAKSALRKRDIPSVLLAGAPVSSIRSETDIAFG